MTYLFKHIALTGRPDRKDTVVTAMQVIEFAVAESIAISVEEPLAEAVGYPQLAASSTEMLNVCDIVIAIGGDGSILRAARQLSAAT